MAEDKTDSTNPLPFEEYARQTLATILAQQNQMRQEMNELRQETIERFLQLSRQIRDLDQKVDVYTREHIYIKDDVRELRAKMNLQ